MSFRKFLAVLSAVVLFGVSAVADATTMLFLTREELTQRSDLVARVRVGKATTARSEDGKAIVTRTELEIVTLLKGKPSGPIVVQQFGGTYDGKTQKVLGDGVLRRGEDAVVFLKNDDKGKTYLTALALSVYHVDTKGMVRRELDGVEFVRYEDGKLAPDQRKEQAETVEALMTDVVRLAGGN